MSVNASSPPPPFTSNLRPPTSRAVSGADLPRAFSGCSVSARVVCSIDARMAAMSMSILPRS
jgi:hypothetical protein